MSKNTANRWRIVDNYQTGLHHFNESSKRNSLYIIVQRLYKRWHKMLYLTVRHWLCLPPTMFCNLVEHISLWRLAKYNIFIVKPSTRLVSYRVAICFFLPVATTSVTLHSNSHFCKKSTRVIFYRWKIQIGFQWHIIVWMWKN